MPDLRTIIGETLGIEPFEDWTVKQMIGVVHHEYKYEETNSEEFADRMIAAIADRVAAALVSDEAVKAALRGANAEAWSIHPSTVRAALQAAAETIKK